MVLCVHVEKLDAAEDSTWLCCMDGLGHAHNSMFSGMHGVGPWTGHGKKLICVNGALGRYE